jgi:hypothetical protein
MCDRHRPGAREPQPMKMASDWDDASEDRFSNQICHQHYKQKQHTKNDKEKLGNAASGGRDTSEAKTAGHKRDE